jgi:internalin A
LQNKYPNIKKIVAVSCKAQEGLEELQAAIDIEISKLENVQDRLPLSWFEIKNMLEQMQEDYIPYSDYELICQQNQIDDFLSQNTLIELLHQLGIVLSFRDDARLAEMGVLNPEWVTNGVYKILNDNLLLTEHRGILESSDLSRILDSHRYPSNKRLFIVDMMRKFELCFSLEDSVKERVLIPDLLSKEEPATGDWENAKAFQYHYDVLPHSIISRFIVRIHHLAEKRTWWRTGIVLMYQNNRAIIKADREDKRILILVNGSASTRRELLAIIRSEFNAIHQTIKGLEVKQKVPILKYPNILVDYEHLLNLAEIGIRNFVPEGLKEVSVKQLLDGIEVKQSRQKRQREGNNKDTTMMDRSLANRPTINIYNQNAQENRNIMSNVQQNHYGKGDNVAGNKTLNQFNNSTNLAEVVRDIKELLAELSKDYPNDSQAAIGAKAADRIESSPSIKQRVVGALKEVGATAIEEAIDHPAIKFVLAAVKGYMDA